jgi:alpha-L-arabinofuranosidase
MYRVHMGAKQVPVANPVAELNVPVLAGQARLPGLSASASLRERQLAVTLTNPSAESSLKTRLRISGGSRPAEARGTVLAHSDMRGENTFSRPDEVKPAALPATVSGDGIEVVLPKRSVAVVECMLA